MDNAFFNELKELAELARGSEEWSRKIYRMAIHLRQQEQLTQSRSRS